MGSLGRNSDPRLLLACVAILPFAGFITGALLIWLFWNQWWSVTIGITVIVAGLRLPPFFPRLNGCIYKMCFRRTLAEMGSADWVAVEMEKTGTQDSFRLLPHTVGIVLRKGDSFELVQVNGEVVSLDVGKLNFRKVSRTNWTCPILVTAHNAHDVIGYVITPIYKGQDLKIAADGNLRFEWFLEWMGVDPVENSM